MMKELQKLLEIREIAFDAVDARISCFPHVVNLATQSILKSMTNPNQNDELEGQGDVSRVDDDDNVSEQPEAEDAESKDSTNSDELEEELDDAAGTAATQASDNDPDNDSKSEDSDGPRTGATSYEDACKSDPISLCRKIARTVRSSGPRREEFHELIIKGNAKGWFKVDGKISNVPVLQLLLDMRIRWDSTFIMIKRFIELQPVRLIIFFEFFSKMLG
jgi:hypothetical protein